VAMKLLLQIPHAIRKWKWRLLKPVTVGVRVLVEDNGSVLLVKHTYDDLWYLPGGGVNRGETLEGAIRREAAEEVGAQLGQLRLLGVYTNFAEYKSDHVLVFVCHDCTLTGVTDHEIARFGLFDLEALPEATSPATRRRIKEYLTGSTVPGVHMW
jgi:ADP-ribose pyrophosphatase YjhB (NUDIX family)